MQGKIILNGEYVLSKPDYDGVNYTFFSYAISRSRKIIRKEDFSKEAGQKNIKKINKTDVRSILENGMKNKNLINVFFPRISNDSAYFRNDVTVKDLIDEKINEKDINHFLKTNKKITRIKPQKDTLKHI